MKLTVLVDNNTYIDQYYWGEPGLCIYLEDGDRKILLDTGYSEIFMHNARLMDIDLSGLTDIVFSHGHNDHTRGLAFFWREQDLREVVLTAHPDIFLPKEHDDLDIGTPFTEEDAAKHMRLRLSKGPVRLSEHLTWLGEIPRTVPFENNIGIGRYRRNLKWYPDDLIDDTALVYEGEEGLFVITGCSHSGICNIISYAEKLYKKPVTGVIGGFHLMQTDTRLTQTVKFLKEHVHGTCYPCHCVCLAARHEMMNELQVAEVATGMKMEIV
ncbi:MAG: MBL fold metallo-hydrolase [Solobacterium sp.]|nr:MBL fold metallo-hydrolase [Solobacterium sp.]